MSQNHQLRNVLLIGTAAISLFLLAGPVLKPHVVYASLRRSLRTGTLPRWLLSQAPLRGNDSDAVPGWYFVHLTPGSTVEQHKISLGPEIHLDSHIDNIYQWNLSHVGEMYVGKDVDDAWLAAIRRDPRVQLVECDSTKARWIGPVSHKELDEKFVDKSSTIESSGEDNHNDNS